MIWDFHDIVVKCYPKLDVIGAGGSACKVDHSHSWQIGAGVWWGALVSLHVDPSPGLIDCPHDVVVSLPQNKTEREREREREREPDRSSLYVF